MNVAVAAALAAWTGRTLADDELLTIAMNIEAQVIDVPTGVQDYRPALYGGVSAVELDVTGVRRTALGVDLGGARAADRARPTPARRATPASTTGTSWCAGSTAIAAVDRRVRRHPRRRARRARGARASGLGRRRAASRRGVDAPQAARARRHDAGDRRACSPRRARAGAHGRQGLRRRRRRLPRSVSSNPIAARRSPRRSPPAAPRCCPSRSKPKGCGSCGS